ncbi:MAG: arsenite methyltransferase [Planctomycetes bacterium]|nr:arsenite methyltransferase [Planctomycetota bacterium]
MNEEETPVAKRTTVRQKYAIVAEGGCCGPRGDTSGCCAPASDPDELAAAIGYSREDLDKIPGGANMGLSCGNPAAIAALNEGEVVVDLGSGAGFDAFLAGPKVGQSGRVIGVDMTQEMLDKARKNTESYTQRTGLSNIEFRLGEIEYLPLADNSVDVIISNCVLNLSTDKQQVWKEISRVLKPGGRVCASDIALFKSLPEKVKEKVENWVGCVAGAIIIDDYRQMIEEAGLEVKELKPKPEYVETLVATGDAFYKQIQDGLDGKLPQEYVTSIDVLALQKS